MGKFFIVKRKYKELNFEFVERKGEGHPDTLADTLAEKLSVDYSNYTLKKYGAILHHNFDKVSLLGGSSFVSFGKGYLENPIRVLLNGRASTRFGKEEIPVQRLLIDWTKEFFKAKFPQIEPNKNLEFHYNITSKSSPGRRSLFISSNAKEESEKSGYYWFEPRSLDDIPELKRLVSNDTSLGVGFAPYTELEKIVLEIETHLNSSFYKTQNRWMGSDIKIMGFRFKKDFSITICVPQIANYVKDINEYKNNIETIKKTIYRIISKHPIDDFEVNLNTRDDYNLGNIYLSAIGSSIESGDEGVVGRGNRINGIITPLRPMSIEGSCGKNPVYYVGKVYYVAANKLAKEIYKKFGIHNEVYLASQVGRELIDPWVTLVAVPEKFERKIELKELIIKGLKKIPNLTNGILKQRFIMC